MKRIPNDLHFTSHLQNIRSISLLSKAQELELAIASRAGDLQARDKLIHHNLRLVVHLAAQYRQRHSPEELIGEGTLGLIKAARSFNPDRGYSFASYASFFIKEAICRYLRETSLPVHIPKNKLSELQRLQQLHQKDASFIGHFESFENLTEEEQSRSTTAYALATYPQPDVAYSQKHLRAEVKKHLRKLPKLSRIVIAWNYGFSGKRRTLSDIAEKLHTPRSKVRRAYETAITQLRTRNQLTSLRDYIL